MKKVFAIAALAFSMALVSCGGDKGSGTDSDSVATNDVSTNKVADNISDANKLIQEINNATSVEELMNLQGQFKKMKDNLPEEMVQMIDAAGKKKGAELMQSMSTK